VIDETLRPMSGTEAAMGSPARGAPLVATWRRWAACAAAVALAFVVALQGCLLVMHSVDSVASHAGELAVAIGVSAVMLYWLLQAEEARLARELRTARTGTPALRSMVAGRRLQAPLFARPFSTRLGTAAVLLADGERASAVDLLTAPAPLMGGGRLSRLREIVEADAARADGSPEALDGCIARLASREPLHNREADLYALHVLAKAVLERGDSETAAALETRLAGTGDGDERPYLLWLRTWFDLDGGRAGDGRSGDDAELRLAALLARAHGAEKLVAKLEERASAIARLDRQE
jgi:hypothetical protein